MLTKHKGVKTGQKRRYLYTLKNLTDIFGESFLHLKSILESCEIINLMN